MSSNPPRERFFDRDYAEHAVLRDGTRVLVRLVRPDDKTLLQTGFERLSPESRYARCLAAKTTLTADELRYLTECDHENHLAIGAVREGATDDVEPIGLGIARFIRDSEASEIAEAAIAVADEAHGQGLGRLLFLRLCAAAAEREIARFRCEVLGSNVSMKALIDRVSPERTVEVGGGILSIELVLPHVAPTEAATGSAPQGAMYRLFRAAAANAVDWTQAVRRLWRVGR